jgi:hypothetical protein
VDPRFREVLKGTEAHERSWAARLVWGARLGLAEQDSGGTRNLTRGVIGFVNSAPVVLAAENHKAGEMANGEVGSANRYANTRPA